MELGRIGIDSVLLVFGITEYGWNLPACRSSNDPVALHGGCAGGSNTLLAGADRLHDVIA